MTPSLSITHSVHAEDVAFALNGFDEADLKRFVRDLFDELDEFNAEVFAQAVREHDKFSGDADV